ncbi:MAG: NEW3 domain-containing protein [Candidatus Aenigmarchaeota archaeon]|nr:NEW3 domain-containing protein [Candidatus Aenigmarchaeota archaeon]
MMGSKSKIAIPVMIFALCLLVFGVYAAVTFTATPATVVANWTNTTIGGSCYATNLTITNALAGVNIININTTDSNTSTIIQNASFYVKDIQGQTTNQIIIAAGSSTNVTLIFNAGTLSPGKYFGKVSLNYSNLLSDNQLIDVNLTVPQSLSNLIGLETIPKINLGMNTTATAIFYINNTEDYDIYIQQIDNTTNLISGTNKMNYTFALTSPMTVSAKTNSSYSATVVIDTSKTNNVPGLYSTGIRFNTTNGCPDQAYNLTLYANLTNELNNSIVSIVNTTPANDMALPGGEINIAVNPRYWDGSLVSGLTNASFSIWMEHLNNSVLTTDAKYNLGLASTNVTENVDSYTLKTFVPSNALGGTYKLYVNVSDGLNSDLTEYNNFVIDQTALKLTETCTGNLHPGNLSTCWFNITNYGYRTAVMNTTVYKVASGGLTISTPVDKINNFSNITTATLASFNTVANSTTFDCTAGTCSLNATAYTTRETDKWDVQTMVKAFTFTITTTEESNDDGSDDGTGGGTGETPTTKVSKMAVVAPDTLNLDRGQTKATTITVQNTGSYNIKSIKLTVSGIPSSWFTSLASKDVSVIEKSKTFDVTFKIPSDAEPKAYSVVVTASGTDVINKPISATDTITLTVNPDETAKEEMEVNLTMYKAEYENVLKAYNSSLKSGKNVSAELNETINQLTGMFASVDTYLGEEKYAEAYETLVQIGYLLADAKDELGLMTGNSLFDLSGLFNFTMSVVDPQILVVIAGVGLVGVIIYFNKVKPKTKIAKKLKYSYNKGFGDKLKDRFKR